MEDKPPISIADNCGIISLCSSFEVGTKYTNLLGVLSQFKKQKQHGAVSDFQSDKETSIEEYDYFYRVRRFRISYKLLKNGKKKEEDGLEAKVI